MNVINTARDKLHNLGDGKVILEKDDSTGISVVTIDNNEKKNALSGGFKVILILFFIDNIQILIAKLKFHLFLSFNKKDRVNLFICIIISC